MHPTYWRIHLSWRNILHPSILKVWSLSCPQDLKNYLHTHRDTLSHTRVLTYTITHRIYINFYIAQKRKKKSLNIPDANCISIYSHILCTFFCSCQKQHVTHSNCQERGTNINTSASTYQPWKVLSADEKVWRTARTCRRKKLLLKPELI